MKKIYKYIVTFFATSFVTIIIIVFHFKGALILTYDIIKELKNSDKSIATLGELTDYYASTSMDVMNLKYKESTSNEVFLDIYNNR